VKQWAPSGSSWYIKNGADKVLQIGSSWQSSKSTVVGFAPGTFANSTSNSTQSQQTRTDSATKTLTIRTFASDGKTKTDACTIVAKYDRSAQVDFTWELDNGWSYTSNNGVVEVKKDNETLAYSYSQTQEATMNNMQQSGGGGGGFGASMAAMAAFMKAPSGILLKERVDENLLNVAAAIAIICSNSEGLKGIKISVSGGGPQPMQGGAQM
jgi:hypothetical protein